MKFLKASKIWCRSMGSGKLEVWRWEVGGYLAGDVKVFLKAAMLFIKSKACL